MTPSIKRAATTLSIVVAGLVWSSSMTPANALSFVPSESATVKAYTNTCQVGQYAVAAALTGSTSSSGRLTIHLRDLTSGAGTTSADWPRTGEDVVSERWRTVTAPVANGGTYAIDLSMSGGAYVVDARVDCIWAKDLPYYQPQN